ncbi:diguanylate cyclase/phosphodiesterase [Clostridium aceticum]|uniref:Diguanylate cyclase/phosphodiesterase n=1 Tax=Clostridium aceticum TaxID=84022 RepID=A0A0G3WAK4_9CLOT|nr:EAL domain-containing protein [Clostridium aceticum]AKL95666.1 diguanylate cyclase/phosphodiesterase [Clostridium aceticum]
MAMAVVKNNLKQEYLNILKNGEITTSFQPIISLKDGAILGYEALSRGPINSHFYYPDELFHYAKKVNKVWELDLLCRLRAIEKAKSIVGDKLLFINIDSDIIKDSKFKKGFTKEFLKDHNIDSDHVIFELTEHTAVVDYKVFNQVLENYRHQGYRIAIDDAGDGYSGLRLMTEIRPHFIKIDMSLIRDIDKDMIKRELLKSFHQFSRITNIQVIAEGIETYEELKTLIEIGIPYGQGYYIQRPSEDFVAIPSKLKEEIGQLNHQNKKIQRHPTILTIGVLKRRDFPLQYNNTCHQANDIFSESYNLQGIVVVKEKHPVGLIMRHKFYYQMQKEANRNNFLSRPLSTVMDHSPLVLDHSLNIKDASTIAMSREESKVYDYIIVTEGEEYKGIVPIACLLNAFTTIKYIG